MKEAKQRFAELNERRLLEEAARTPYVCHERSLVDVADQSFHPKITPHSHIQHTTHSIRLEMAISGGKPTPACHQEGLHSTYIYIIKCNDFPYEKYQYIFGPGPRRVESTWWQLFHLELPRLRSSEQPFVNGLLHSDVTFSIPFTIPFGVIPTICVFEPSDEISFGSFKESPYGCCLEPGLIVDDI